MRFIRFSLEEMLSGLLENCRVVPFGSSVNGLGRYNSDLDMAMLLNGHMSSQVRFAGIKSV